MADNNFNCFPSLLTIEWAASALLVSDPLLFQISWLIFEIYLFKEDKTYGCQ